VSAKHEWLNLLEVSGPFLAVPVLREVFPQGLEELDSSRAKRLRSAYEEWRDAVDGDDADRDKLHAAWIDEVLRTALEADDQLLKAGKDVPASIVELPEHDTAIVRPSSCSSTRRMARRCSRRSTSSRPTPTSRRR
jgi:hypothetical protein